VILKMFWHSTIATSLNVLYNYLVVQNYFRICVQLKLYRYTLATLFLSFFFPAYCKLFSYSCILSCKAQCGQIIIELNVIRRNMYPPSVTLSEKYPWRNYFWEIRKEAVWNEHILSLCRARLVTNNKNTVIR